MFLLSSLLLCTPVLGRYRHNLDVTDAFVTINEQFSGPSSAYQGIKAIYKIDNRCKFVRYRNGDLTKAIVTEKYDDGAEICFMSPVTKIKVVQADRTKLMDRAKKVGGNLPDEAWPIITSAVVEIWKNNKLVKDSDDVPAVPVDERTKAELGVKPQFANTAVKHGQLAEDYIFNCNKYRFSHKVIEHVFMPKGTDVRILRFAFTQNKGWSVFFMENVDYEYVWVHAHGITFKRATNEISLTQEVFDQIAGTKPGIKWEEGFRIQPSESADVSDSSENKRR